jgi:hypothetical protein
MPSAFGTEPKAKGLKEGAFESRRVHSFKFSNNSGLFFLDAFDGYELFCELNHTIQNQTPFLSALE